MQIRIENSIFWKRKETSAAPSRPYAADIVLFATYLTARIFK
jgi:hypothetical protein